MILTTDRKRKFLITMIIIMACATAINYGLYNVLSGYLKTDDNNDIYSGVQLNIIIVLVIIAVVTVIMVALIPKENIQQVLIDIESNNGGMNGNGTVLRASSEGSSRGDNENNDDDLSPLGTDNLDSEIKKLDDMVDEDIEEGLNIGEGKK